MNIDSSYTNIQNLNDIQSSSLEKLGTSKVINSSSDDPSGLIISDALGTQKSALSQSLENMNSGIAMSNIAQSGISSQKEILENIKVETLKAMNGTTSQQDRENIAQTIGKYIDQYTNISSSTKYNNMSLLKVDQSVKDDISIISDDITIDMEKADTTSISDGLKSLLSDFATNSFSMQQMLTNIDLGIDQLSKYSSSFASSSNAMQSIARNSISSEAELSKAQSTVLDIDYSKEVSDFSKSNIMSQIGYLVQTQANAHLQRNIDILS